MTVEPFLISILSIPISTFLRQIVTLYVFEVPSSALTTISITFDGCAAGSFKL